jgi:hypothetical protein
LAAMGRIQQETAAQALHVSMFRSLQDSMFYICRWHMCPSQPDGRCRVAAVTASWTHAALWLLGQVTRPRAPGCNIVPHVRRRCVVT